MLRTEPARRHLRAEGEVALTISVSCRRVTPASRDPGRARAYTRTPHPTPLDVLNLHEL